MTDKQINDSASTVVKNQTSSRSIIHEILKLKYHKSEKILQYLKFSRPTPNLPDFISTKQEENDILITYRFNVSTYEQVDWLTGCESESKLYCWPCIFFNDTKVSFIKHGYKGSVVNLPRALISHCNSSQHNQSVAKFNKCISLNKNLRNISKLEYPSQLKLNQNYISVNVSHVEPKQLYPSQVNPSSSQVDPKQVKGEETVLQSCGQLQPNIVYLYLGNPDANDEITSKQELHSSRDKEILPTKYIISDNPEISSRNDKKLSTQDETTISSDLTSKNKAIVSTVDQVTNNPKLISTNDKCINEKKLTSKSHHSVQLRKTPQNIKRIINNTRISKLLKLPIDSLERIHIFKLGITKPLFCGTKNINSKDNKQILDCYNTFDWLAGCSLSNNFYCWPCLFFNGELRMWNSYGCSNFNYVKSLASLHIKALNHKVATSKFKKFESALLIQETPISSVQKEGTSNVPNWVDIYETPMNLKENKKTIKLWKELHRDDCNKEKD